MTNTSPRRGRPATAGPASGSTNASIGGVAPSSRPRAAVDRSVQLVDDELQQLGLAALRILVDQAAAALELNQGKRAEGERSGQWHGPARRLAGSGAGIAGQAAPEITGEPDRRRYPGGALDDGGEILQPRLESLHLCGGGATRLARAADRRERPGPPRPRLGGAVTDLRDRHRGAESDREQREAKADAHAALSAAAFSRGRGQRGCGRSAG